jgi:prophage antirepressor-like protein
MDGEPWFVGKDVAVVLGYTDTKQAIRNHVDDEDKLTRQIVVSDQNRNVIIINESGLYSLILSSKLPKAKEFKHWVTSEVLPSIRKHGAYMTDDVLRRAITEPDFLIQLATELKEEQEKRRALESTVAVQSQQITELQPKASYYDVVLNSKDLLSIGKIAKDFGKSAVWLNKWLHEQGVQYKQGEIWLLYQKYAEQGYTNTKTQTYNGSDGAVHTKVHTYWTQKGRLFIYDLLKTNGILPLICQIVVL